MKLSKITRYDKHIAYPKVGAGKAGPVILFFWFLFASLVPNAVLSVTEKMTWMQSLANMLLPAGLYWLAMAGSRNPGKPVLWMFPITFLAAFELVLLYLYGRSVIAVDMWLNIVTSNSSEMMELLKDLVPILSVVVVLYLTPVIMAIFSIADRWRLSEKFIVSQRLTALVILAAGMISFILAFFIGERRFRPLNDIFPLNAVTNCVIAFDRYHATKNYRNTSASYRHHSSQVAELGDSLGRIVVVVIGETSRGDNWQLGGYSRPTNPRLSKRSNLVYFPRTMSESNTTHKSVPMLLSPIDAATFIDSINYVSGIIDAFNEAGYNTAFFSAQQRNHSYIDFMGEEADEARFIIEEPGIGDAPGVRDRRLVESLRQVINDSRGNNMVVLHSYGSHYNYSDRYPTGIADFGPDRPLEAESSCREKLINAYDNTIIYTDYILDEVIRAVEQSGRRGAVIYASDHGEDIFDDDRGLFLHASPVPSYWQLHVPMLVWTSDSFNESHPQAVAALRANAGKQVSSSRSLYHTALDLGDISTADYQRRASLMQPGYTLPKRLYLTDHNEAVDYREAGFDPEDFEALQRKGIEN